MLIFEKIAEQKISEWIEKENFKNNKYYKKYIDNTDYFKVPEHLRITFHILKNANVLPKEIQLKKEISNLKEILLEITEEDIFIKKIKKFNILVAELNIISNKKIKTEEIYCKKLMKKLTGIVLKERLKTK